MKRFVLVFLVLCLMSACSNSDHRVDGVQSLDKSSLNQEPKGNDFTPIELSENPNDPDMSGSSTTREPTSKNE